MQHGWYRSESLHCVGSSPTRGTRRKLATRSRVMQERDSVHLSLVTSLSWGLHLRKVCHGSVLTAWIIRNRGYQLLGSFTALCLYIWRCLCRALARCIQHLKLLACALITCYGGLRSCGTGSSHRGRYCGNPCNWKAILSSLTIQWDMKVTLFILYF